MKKTLSALTLAAGLLFAAAPASAAPIIVSFAPSSTHLNVGDSVTIDMSISGLGDEILSAFDFNAIWNSSVATWTVFDVSPGCGQLGASLCGIDTTDANNLGANGSSLLFDDDLAAIQPDSFLIARFTLRGAADGVTTFTLGLDADPDFERNFVGRDAATLDVAIGSACVAVGTGSCGGGNAPEPASLALIGLGLLAAVATGRRRRTRDLA